MESSKWKKAATPSLSGRRRRRRNEGSSRGREETQCIGENVTIYIYIQWNLSILDTLETGECP